MVRYAWIARLEGGRGQERWAHGMHRVLLRDDVELGALVTVELFARMRPVCGKTWDAEWRAGVARPVVPFLDREKKSGPKKSGPKPGRRETRVVGLVEWSDGAREPRVTWWRGAPFLPCGHCTRGPTAAGSQCGSAAPAAG